MNRWWHETSTVGKIHIAGLPLFAIVCVLCALTWWMLLGHSIEQDLSRHYIAKVLNQQEICFDVDANVEAGVCKVAVTQLHSESWDGLVKVVISVTDDKNTVLGTPVTSIVSLEPKSPRCEKVEAVFGPFEHKFNILVDVSPYIGGGL